MGALVEYGKQQHRISETILDSRGLRLFLVVRESTKFRERVPQRVFISRIRERCSVRGCRSRDTSHFVQAAMDAEENPIAEHASEQS